MNLLTINNKNLVGYDVNYFLKFYEKQAEYRIDRNENGILIIYEQYIPFQMFEVLLNEKKIYDINIFLEERVKYLYKLSKSKLEITDKICFFYPFTFYSKFDYAFNFLEILKEKIETIFKKEVFFVFNNHVEDDKFLHFNAFRYDIFNDARKTAKIKNENEKEKIFISLNAKERKHREDLQEFLIKENILKNFYFSYTRKNINLWLTSDFIDFGDKYLKNEFGSGHLAFEYYLNDDFFNIKNGHYFDKSYYYIVTETSCDDRLCFISEKTYKAFYHKIPFIIIGNPYILKNLQKEGFQTFNKWIDESYDNETNYEKRKKMIFNEIKRLNNLSQEKHKKMNEEMREKLDFNYNHFFDLSKFKETFLKMF
jgi:hypothetical protein